MTADVVMLGTSFIDNRWTRGEGPRFVAINPTTVEPCAEGNCATHADVDRAVRAARLAFPKWSSVPRAERAQFLRGLHAILVARSEEFVTAMATEIGSPVWFGRAVQMGMPLANLEVAISSIETHFHDEQVGTSLVVREPIGVVAAITPWNAPVHQIVAKTAAALAAGCTVVLKPSEIAPVTASMFADAVRDAGVPNGVFNVVFGNAAVGQALVGHPGVDMVTFTGSTPAGRAVAQLAAQGIKKVALELGGKSASILLDDTLVETAAGVILRQCFSNSGQICVAQSRFLVPRRLLERVAGLCHANAAQWVMGDPLSESTRMGPVATKGQYDRVLGYISSGLEQGAKLLAGGPDPVIGMTGYFVRPTVFSEVSAEMKIAQEEIFGPVLCILPYDSLDEAIEIANSLHYGLSGGVWSSDVALASAVARRMRTGQVAINGAAQNLATPFGGYGKSGYGRENGRYGIDEFLNYKAIHGVGSA